MIAACGHEKNNDRGLWPQITMIAACGHEKNNDGGLWPN
jgi:hypothetical protein